MKALPLLIAGGIGLWIVEKMQHPAAAIAPPAPPADPGTTYPGAVYPGTTNPPDQPSAVMLAAISATQSYVDQISAMLATAAGLVRSLNWTIPGAITESLNNARDAAAAARTAGNDLTARNAQTSGAAAVNRATAALATLQATVAAHQVVPPPNLPPPITQPDSGINYGAGPMPNYTAAQIHWLQTPQYNGPILTKGRVYAWFLGDTPPPAVPTDAKHWWQQIDVNGQGSGWNYSFLWPQIPPGI